MIDQHFADFVSFPVPAFADPGAGIPVGETVFRKYGDMISECGGVVLRQRYAFGGIQLTHSKMMTNGDGVHSWHACLMNFDVTPQVSWSVDFMADTPMAALVKLRENVQRQWKTLADLAKKSAELAEELKAYSVGFTMFPGIVEPVGFSNGQT